MQGESISTALRRQIWLLHAAVCRSAGRQVVVDAAGKATVNQLAPSPAPPHKSNVTGTTPFFFDFAKLSDGDIELVTVITAATCIRYQLLGARCSLFRHSAVYTWSGILGYGPILSLPAVRARC